MTQQRAKKLLGVLVTVLFVGTLMPGAWKDSAIAPWHSPVDLAAVAHVLMFAAISAVLPRAQPWPVRAWHVFPASLLLAVTTEGLQYFAIDRHPNLAGILQDMTGAFMGWMLARRWAAAPPPVNSPDAQAIAASSRGQASRSIDK